MRKLLSQIHILLALLVLSACSDNKTDLKSQVIEHEFLNNTLICSQGSANGLAVKQQAMRDGNTMVIDINYTLIRFTAIPESFYTSSSGSLTLHKWKATSGNSRTGETQIQFRPMMEEHGYIGPWMNEITLNSLTSLASAYSMDVKTLMSKIAWMVFVDDSLGEYEGLNIKHSTSGAQLDLLLLPIALHPADYAKDPDGSTRPGILQTLHPLQAFSSETKEQLAQRADAFCF